MLSVLAWRGGDGGGAGFVFLSVFCCGVPRCCTLTLFFLAPSLSCSLVLLLPFTWIAFARLILVRRVIISLAEALGLETVKAAPEPLAVNVTIDLPPVAAAPGFEAMARRCIVRIKTVTPTFDQGRCIEEEDEGEEGERWAPPGAKR